MANAKATLYYTKEQYLDSLPVENGNVIFVPDSNKVCLDIYNQRYSYQTIIVFPTEADRLAAEDVVEGFYFVESSKTVWRYTNGWARISAKGSDFVVYGETTEAFPQEGEEEKLYFTDNGIYNWKEQLNKYNLIANANTWDGIADS